ncbi:MAG TPA: class I adenylate-forming enzyme family protein [Xanthobacteraceae bacterium]|jgi:acyl-CoA synthetase (AMP-forming)/AMP-acid ligase II
MNIVDPILFQCRRQPPTAAICVPGPGIGLISYRRLETFIHNVSRRLLSLGLPPGSIVAVNIEDVIFHAVVLLAATRLGMVTISLRQDNVSLPINVAALITAAKSSFTDVGRVVLADLSWTEGDGQPLEPHHLPRADENAICRIILTSGTTNEPKAVALSQRLLAARINRHWTVFGNRFANCQCIYSDVPISSSLGFQSLIYALWRGGTAFFPGNDFAGTLRVFEEYKVQCLVGSPGGFENLLRWFETIPAYQSNVELLVCGGDVLSRSLSDRLRSRICSHLIAAYGSTEASMSATAHAHEIADMARAVGFVTPGVAVQVVDATGTMLGAGAEGYIRIRSEFAVDGYLGKPEASANIFRDGWFYPGDIGTLSPDGLLAISGREQTVLNLGGDKINPETVELALSQFKGIVEAAVCSAPNELGNNEIFALVVSREKLDERQLRTHCEARLPRTFVPVKFLPIDSLPHNEMGKIDRRQLPELCKRALGRAT